MKVVNFIFPNDYRRTSRKKSVLWWTDIHGPEGQKAGHVDRTEDMDEALLKEVVRLGPYEVGHGKVTATWTKAALVMHEFDLNISARACQTRCDTMLHKFSQDNQRCMRASGVEEDDDDIVKLKQDILDRRDDAKMRRTRKRDSEHERLDELELAGVKACSDAEERVSKRLSTSSSSSVKSSSKMDVVIDPMDQLMEFERKRHEDDHTFRMERLHFERQEQEMRRNDQKQMSLLLEKLIDKLGNYCISLQRLDTLLSLVAHD
ncbi:hypothetical protein DYB28_004861 [Aphanomyces astaci]|uniref:Uncharacterized protein n=1 Tax=Aphanomyces astaci TaxID=112090 RepID=A0A9X8DY98_APHAT|nr:hypothetical protein DYB28_004861 [Aphanomyces astaci]